MSNLLIVDVHALFHRCRNAIRKDLTSKGGTSCRGAYTLLRTLLKELNSGDYTHVVAATEGFQSGSANRELDANYKSNRQKNSDEFYQDLGLTFLILELLNIPIISCPGQEADDVIATLARQSPVDVTVYTCDSDLFQLIEGTQVKVKQYTSAKKIKVWDEVAFQEKYDVGPEWYVEHKAIVGDAADNIPGIPGLGSKKASQIINELRVGWRNHPKLQGEGIQERLNLNLELISLCDLLPVRLPSLEEVRISWDEEAVERSLVDGLGFVSMRGKCGCELITKEDSRC